MIAMKFYASVINVWSVEQIMQIVFSVYTSVPTKRLIINQIDSIVLNVLCLGCYARSCV